MSIRICLIFILSLLSSCIYSQITHPDAGMISSQFSPSPISNAMGSIGTSSPINDAFGFYYNPARLGYSSKESNFSFQLSPKKLAWPSPVNGPDVTFESRAFNAGWNFDKLIKGFPFRVGLGYMKSRFDYGESFGNDEDYCNSYSLGIGFDYYVSVNFGITYKKATEKFRGLGGKTYKASLGAADYGLLLVAPIWKLSGLPQGIEYSKGLYLSPKLNLSLGYARRNQGGEFYFINPAQSDPIARTDNLGYTLSAGIEMDISSGNTLSLLTMDWSTEIEDLLVYYEIYQDYDYKLKYKGMLKDINIWKNLICGELNKKIIRHRGLKLEIGEMLQFYSGSVAGDSYYSDFESKGVGFRTKGLLKLLKLCDSRTIDFIADHFDLQYVSSRFLIFSDYNGKEIESLQFSISGIEKLF
ncbi:MAG: hypothetical protein Q8933_21805 [Bacteroidota bacterium]|nr:hypothetical protein [Bacteroidota bacterium]